MIPNNPEAAVLLLHGAAFTSQTWADLGTLDVLSKAKIATVAIDIPRYGKSKDLPKVKSPTDFLDKVILDFAILQHHPLFILSPSMSGGISLPYLFNRGNEKLAGFIAVAPVGGPDPRNVEKFERVEIPVQIVYGEEDGNLGVKGMKVMKSVPNHEIVMIPGGKHPCYLDDPDLFHTSIIKFMQDNSRD